MFAVVLVCHVLAAIGVGPILTLPILANAPAALRTVLILLRFGAGVTLVSGIFLWIVLKPAHPIWLYLSVALYVVVIVTISTILAPAVNLVAHKPELRRRIFWAGIAASALTLGITALMVLQPSWS